MKKIILLSILSISLFSSCLNDLTNTEQLAEGVFKVEVLEVVQSSQYTYFKGIMSGAEMWFAVGKMELQVGSIYYYKEPLEMQNFKSKELDKTFEFIYFINKLQVKPEFTANTADVHKKITTEKANSIEIEHVEGAITIAELFENKDKYNGKLVRLQGKVVKYNPNIMNKNWIHIQDGTEFKNQFDLTLTSEANAKLGDIIIIEGIVRLDKDFGSGYKYDVIVENAQLK